MIKLFYALAMTLLLFSCGQRTEKTDVDSVKEGNKSTTLSTDTSKLSKLINIKDYKPTHVKFKYIFMDNSGKSDRLSIPGPSDSYLQVVLYFDKPTFKQLRTAYANADYPPPAYDRQNFNFVWLDTAVGAELLRSDTGYHGHPDYFFGLGLKDELWFLEDKVLLTKTTD